MAASTAADAATERILTPEALDFVIEIHRRFDGRRRELLEARAERRERIAAGQLPGFIPETAEIRAGDWMISPTPPDLQDRRVEITGPTDRKMVINALNSGARMSSWPTSRTRTRRRGRTWSRDRRT